MWSVASAIRGQWPGIVTQSRDSRADDLADGFTPAGGAGTSSAQLGAAGGAGTSSAQLGAPQWKSSLESLECDAEQDGPASVVVFDLDETLTAHTVMPKALLDAPDSHWRVFADRSFASAWVPNRLQQLARLLKDLKDEPGRLLAVLTKNKNRDGAPAVVKLLQAANLAQHIDAVWVIPSKGKPQLAYRMCEPKQACLAIFSRFTSGKCCKDTWKFELLLPSPKTSKPGVLEEVVHNNMVNIAAWFPQLAEVPHNVTWGSVVLVDDDAENFEDSDDKEVPNHCEVARYYRPDDSGKISGGIGAYDVEDFQTLLDFVGR